MGKQDRTYRIYSTDPYFRNESILYIKINMIWIIYFDHNSIFLLKI